jgi:hypothetical protein
MPALPDRSHPLHHSAGGKPEDRGTEAPPDIAGRPPPNITRTRRCCRNNKNPNGPAGHRRAAAAEYRL